MAAGTFVIAFTAVFCLINNVYGEQCPDVSSLNCYTNVGDDCVNTQVAVIKLKDNTTCDGCTFCVDIQDNPVDSEGCPVMACPLVKLEPGCAGKYFSQRLAIGDNECYACGAFQC